jgi:hypothetical protein
MEAGTAAATTGVGGDILLLHPAVLYVAIVFQEAQFYGSHVLIPYLFSTSYDNALTFSRHSSLLVSLTELAYSLINSLREQSR